ncbi:fluoride efflux transporter CrcB [Aphanothece hegewaldii CCALA 016]|uniref:Fluoride-specific ion channel FluC n=1 Tax=Aphanothece hegewaldii CCALA 016 TaxID=2107694 RepID=A0A2T1LX12_9CHRO|nr:fluoride efflux transporter CrcB [Aphanothece hegewaldii]PSF36680.1 fluoride efflux transporter CrcB [Aphanothece hegewaldii CCALA 016]
MEQFLLIFVGGGLGSICRHLVSKFVSQSFEGYYPFGTLTVNLIGCFLIGVLIGVIEKYSIHQNWRFLFVTGFCGGFTTFSTFSYENWIFMRNLQYKALFSYVFASLVGGFWATFFGFWLVRK